MATNFYYPTSKNAIQKTLGAQLLSSATTGDAITFTDVDGIQNLPGVLVINRVDSNGTATPSKREYISYSSVSGTTVIIETRNVDGSGSVVTHAVGSVVEFISDAVWAQRMIDQFKVEHNVDGTHAAVTATTVTTTGDATIGGAAAVTGAITGASATTTGDVDSAGAVKADTVSEHTLDAGVTVDGVLLKDSQVTTDTINEKTLAAGVTVDSVLLKDGGVVIPNNVVYQAKDSLGVAKDLIKKYTDDNTHVGDAASGWVHIKSDTANDKYLKVPLARQGGDLSNFDVSGLTNYKATNAFIQVGDIEVPILSGYHYGSATITFPVAYTYTPVVLVTRYNSTGSENWGNVVPTASSVSPTQAGINLQIADNTNVTADQTYKVFWFAIGPKV